MAAACSVGPASDLGALPDAGAADARGGIDATPADVGPVDPGPSAWITRFSPAAAGSLESVASLEDRLVVGGGFIADDGSADGIMVQVGFGGRTVAGTRQVLGDRGRFDTVRAVILDGVGLELAALDSVAGASLIELDDRGRVTARRLDLDPPELRIAAAVSTFDRERWLVGGTVGRDGWIAVGRMASSAGPRELEVRRSSFGVGTVVTVDEVTTTQSSLERVLGVAGTFQIIDGAPFDVFVEAVESDLSQTRWVYRGNGVGESVLDLVPDQRGGLAALTYADPSRAWLLWLDADGEVFARTPLDGQGLLRSGFLDLVGGIGGTAGVFRELEGGGVAVEAYRLNRDGAIVDRTTYAPGALADVGELRRFAIEDDLPLSDGSFVLAGRAADGALLMRFDPWTSTSSLAEWRVDE
jgi:hypothetical protein